MTGLGCAVMWNLINTHTNINTHMTGVKPNKSRFLVIMRKSGRDATDSFTIAVVDSQRCNIFIVIEIRRLEIRCNTVFLKNFWHSKDNEWLDEIVYLSRAWEDNAADVIDTNNSCDSSKF